MNRMAISHAPQAAEEDWMKRMTLQVQECCEWCRGPVGQCRDVSCDDARTYSGVLLLGDWRKVEEWELLQASLRPDWAQPIVNS